MMFENPNFRKQEKKLNNNIKNNEVTKEYNEDVIFPLDEVLNNTNIIEQKNEFEFIEAPTHGNITGVPRNINMNLEQSGRINIKYENYFSNINKM